MKIISIVGTRPQLIKLASISKTVPSIVIDTGQHYDPAMSDDFVKEFGLEIKYNLKVGSGSHANQTAKMMIELERLFLLERPDLVIVYGDTNSTLAGAITAKKCGIKVAHIESGLRSYQKNMPEEINRVVTDHLSDILFCPDETSLNNLREEGLDGFIIGDPLVDLVLNADIKDNPQDYVFMTLHRADKNEEEFEKIFRFVSKLGQVIWPIHPRIKRINLNIPKNIQVIEPQGYYKTLELIKNARKVVTDSGGVQREAYLLNTPTIIVRNETEWLELLNDQNVLTGKNYSLILKEFEKKDNPMVLNKVGTKLRDLLNAQTNKGK